MQTTVDFLRHGEVKGGSYYRGITDDPLTELGWQQMQQAVAINHWDLIISSPLKRCLDFSKSFSQDNNIPLLIEPNWQEINFGDWEGKTADQIDTTSLMLFYQDPVNNNPNNSEPYQDFLARLNTAWHDLLKQHTGKNILIVTHAGVIRSLFANLLDLPVKKVFNIQIDHASLTQFQCFHDSPDDFITLIHHNLIQPDVYSVNRP